MKFCVFDNPRQYRREIWVDGGIMAWVTHEFIEFAVPGWSRLSELGYPMHEGKFDPGRIVGDPEAMKTKTPA